MPRKKSSSVSEKPSTTRQDRSDIVFRFKLFGIPLLVRPPRLAYLGKTLLAAMPAILVIAGTIQVQIDRGNEAKTTRTVESYRQAITELQASDPKSKAELVFARTLALSPLDTRGWDRFMDFLLASGQSSRLSALLQGLVPGESKGNPGFHLRLANLMLSRPDQSERAILAAERHLRYVSELDPGPNGILARRKLALLAINRGDLPAAFKFLEPVMTENPIAGSEALWLAWSGNLAYDPNAPERVLDRVERDLRAQRIPDPENALAKMRLLVMTNRAEQALEWLALQKTIDPKIRTAIETEVAEMQLIASIKNSGGANIPDWSKLERILNLKPNDPIWLNFAVDIWAGPNKFGAEPVRLWVQSRLDDDSANDVLLRQCLVMLSNQYEAAGKSPEDSKMLRTLYRNYLKRFPQDPVALNNLAVLIYKHEPSSLEEALRLAQAAEAALPNQPTVQETIGQIYARMGRFDEARPILEKCLGPLPDDWGLHNTLVQLYEKSGNADLAAAHRSICESLPKPQDAASFEKIAPLRPPSGGTGR
jgi:tetratricopeptide (TPR) repeat protein